MVVHDESRLQTWMQVREETKEKPERRPGPRSVIVVQSVACCVVLLLAMLLRVAGGDAYQSVRHRFYQALERNELVSAFVLRWDKNPLEEAKSDGKVEDFTAEEPAQTKEFPIATEAMMPLESGTLTSNYGQRIHPIDGTEEFHTGVDIAAPTGTPLLAIYDGEVVEIGEDARIGKYVLLRHGAGLEILYGHCDEVIVGQGDQVAAGTPVALVGSTGVSTGSHVHIRVNVDGVACDPSALLSLDRYA